MKPTPFEWTGRLLADVVLAEVSRTRAAGVVLASPPGVATDLLRGWLEGRTHVVIPDPAIVSAVGRALAAVGTDGERVEGAAWRAVAETWGVGKGFLPIGSTNKTELLLDPAPLPARVLPLGDVWASQLREHLGSASLPPVLAGAAPDEVAAVEGALREYFERGLAPDAAFGGLGELEQPVRAALDAAEARTRGLLVPKLTPWTVGLDLAR